MSEREKRATTAIVPIIKGNLAIEVSLDDPASVAGFLEQLAAMLKISTKVRIIVEFPDGDT